MVKLVGIIVSRINLTLTLTLILVFMISTVSIKNTYAIQDVIALDQKTYHWTDVVGIAIIAPEYNLNSNQAETIGTNGHGSINACTQENCIPISLLETKPDSGVFTGAITLTGASSVDITSNCNPVCDSTSGQIRAASSDQITITFTGTDNQQISASGTIIPSQNISGNVQLNNSAPPNWVKNNAMWWSEGQIGDDDFIKGIQYLIQQGIIIVPSTQVNSQQTQGIPSLVKNNAKYCSEGQVSDTDFINGLQYLVQNGIIVIQNNSQVTSNTSVGYSLPPLLNLPTSQTPQLAAPELGASKP